MPDTIKQRIALDGDADIKKSLAEIGDVGEKSFKRIDDASKQTSASIGALQKDRLARINISPEEFQKRTEAFKADTAATPPRTSGKSPVDQAIGRVGNVESIQALREALHTLHPALAEAGIGFGELGSILRAAGGGIVALGLALAGTLVAALQKAGDTANDAAARLGAFAGSTEKGRDSFDQLKGSAEQLRVPTSDLTAPFEQLLRANQSSPAGTQASDKTLQDTLATFVKASQADRTDFDKAIAGITGFFAGLKETGTLTPDAIAKLADEVSPTLAKQLLDDLTSRLPGKQIYSTQDVVQSTANVAPQVNQNLFKAAADAADGINTSWVHFKAAIERLEEAIGGGSPVASVLNEVSEEIDAIATALKKIREYAKEKFGSGESNPIALGGLGTKLHDAVVGPADTGPTGPGTAERGTQLNYAFRDVAGTTAQLKAGIATTATDGSESWAPAVDALASASEKAAKQVEGHGQAAEGAQTSLNKFAERANKLQIIGSELSKRQSEIDLKFQPKEAESLLAKDQISVQNADIHLQQAKISGLEAQKNREIANLAPEAARENVESARASRDSALSTFLKNRGADTSALDAVNAQGADQRALDAAETALKRAEIEQKYAYLEPKKAELNAQQTETAIRSAELEKNDASLTLAKDDAKNPISHDLAQLRYAQASLDEAKLTNKHGEETVKNLEQILNALTKDAGKRSEESGQKAGSESKPATGIGTGTETVRPQDRNVVPAGEPPRDLSDINKNQADQQSVHQFEQQQADGHVTPEANRLLDEQGLFPRDTNTSGAPTLLHFPQYEQQLREDVGPVPLPQARPPEADQQSSLPPQQFADVGEAVSKIVDAISAKLNEATAKPLDQTGPTENLGIRGESSSEDASKDVADLGDKAGDAASGLGSLVTALSDASSRIESDAGSTTTHAAKGGQILRLAEGGEARLDVSPGGQLHGPGTGKSDSIDAKLSNKEFVVNAEDTEKNLPLLRAINAGHYPRGAVAHLAAGGMASNVSSFVDRLSGLGIPSTIEVPHLAIGGMPNFAAPKLSKSVSEASEQLHPLSVTFPWGSSVDGLHAEPGALAQLQRASVEGQAFSTGKKPSWYGGRG